MRPLTQGIPLLSFFVPEGWWHCLQHRCPGLQHKPDGIKLRAAAGGNEAAAGGPCKGRGDHGGELHRNIINSYEGG